MKRKIGTWAIAIFATIMIVLILALAAGERWYVGAVIALIAIHVHRLIEKDINR